MTFCDLYCNARLAAISFPRMAIPSRMRSGGTVTNDSDMPASAPAAAPLPQQDLKFFGKTASFTITLQKLEWAHLPEVDAEFAKSLGVADGDLAKMREDIKVNLQRPRNAPTP